MDLEDTYYNTALITASTKNNIESADSLITILSADKDLANAMKNTPMIIAAMNGHLHMLRLLVERRANTLVKNIDEKNALDLAEVMGQEETVRYLHPIIKEAKQW